MQCHQCAGAHGTKAGRDRQGRHVYRCKRCGRRVTGRSGSAFRGERVPDEVIARAVRYSPYSAKNPSNTISEPMLCIASQVTLLG